MANQDDLIQQHAGNIWQSWVPEDALREVLAGECVVADTGQVKGLWKRMLEREVRAGRLAKWKGKWYPTPGMHRGLGPDKTCYGTPELRDYFADVRAAFARTAA